MPFRYYKGEPNTYAVAFRDGKVRRHGAGINFWYSPLTTSIAALPLASLDSPFVFNETTADFQTLTIQGTLTYRLVNPVEVAGRLDFTVDPATQRYRSDDPDKLVQRVVDAVQDQTRNAISALSLEEALTSVREFSELVFHRVVDSPALTPHGIALEGLHFTSVRTTPEMQKALEADFREALSKRADMAIYDRRKSAVEEERKIRESELATDIELENRRKALVDTQARNAVTLAEAEARAEELKLSPYGELPPPALIGLAFKEWAANAGNIDSLNITPDLLTRVISYVADTDKSAA